MKPKFADDWTELYYQAVEDYFWEPAIIGRMPDGDSKPWPQWKASLREKEVPLNHILSLFFALAPQDTVDQVLSRLVGAELRGLRLVSEVGGSEDLKGTFTQPDFVFASDSDLLFLEMKIDSKSSVDQFGKYALSAEKLCTLYPNLQRVRLAMLVKDGTFHRVWGSKAIVDEQTLRATAVRGVRGDGEVWKQQGMVTYLKTASEDDRERLVVRIESMLLSISTYAVLGGALGAHVPSDPTAAKLVAGVQVELQQRGLSLRDA